MYVYMIYDCVLGSHLRALIISFQISFLLESESYVWVVIGFHNSFFLESGNYVLAVHIFFDPLYQRWELRYFANFIAYPRYRAEVGWVDIVTRR